MCVAFRFVWGRLGDEEPEGELHPPAAPGDAARQLWRAQQEGLPEGYQGWRNL